MTEAKRAPGRPEGTTHESKSVKSVLKADALATSRLNNEIRELMKQMIKEVRESMRNNASTPKDRVEIVLLLANALQSSGRSMEPVVKMLMATSSEDDNEQQSVEEILETMTGKKS